VAQGRRRRGRRGRAPARGLHRQGRHRGSVPFSGTLTEILVPEDETVEVGTVLARIGGGAPADEAAPKAEAKPEAEPEPAPEPKAEPKPEPKEEPKAEPKPEPKEEPKPTPAPAPAAAPSAEAAAEVEGASSYVTPLVRKLARDLGVDLSTVTGSGVGGRVRKQDVEAAAKPAPAPAAAAPAGPAGAPKAPATIPEVSSLRGTTEKLSRLRKVISERMVESLQTAAQLTTVIEVDLTRVADLRARAKATFQATEGVKLTYLPFLVKAAAEALKAHPKLNASIDGDQVVYHGSENIGIAVDTERGLVVPVIKNAGDLTLGGIAKQIADLATRTRTNKVSPDDLSGATFTVTNTGSGGALFDTPIFSQPQVGILGTGTITRKPVVVPDADGNETIGIRSMMYLAISYDHRLVDGADAARFLQTIKARVEEGAFEAELGL
jgi:2-oxoglutarate dehydrogenase E2 component (dihydrolipoamide succinyltransferase)